MRKLFEALSRPRTRGCRLRICSGRDVVKLGLSSCRIRGRAKKCGAVATPGCSCRHANGGLGTHPKVPGPCVKVAATESFNAPFSKAWQV